MNLWWSGRAIIKFIDCRICMVTIFKFEYRFFCIQCRFTSYNMWVMKYVRKVINNIVHVDHQNGPLSKFSYMINFCMWFSLSSITVTKYSAENHLMIHNWHLNCIIIHVLCCRLLLLLLQVINQSWRMSLRSYFPKLQNGKLSGPCLGLRNTFLIR